jgi:hypothetical protein
MKPIMITLMYLTFGGDIKMDTFEINESCSGWWHHNVVVKEKQKKTFMTNHYYYVYDKKRVIGYICDGEEPK